MRYSFISKIAVILLLSMSAGCAPKTAPPTYRAMELTLQEIRAIAGRGIESMKAVVNIRIQKADMSYYIDGVVLVKRPGWLQARFYNLGMMIGNFVIREGVIYASSGKIGKGFRGFGRELYSSIFWWDGLEGARMYVLPEEYVIRTGKKEIRLDRGTLLPRSQKFRIGEREVSIQYDEPRRYDSLWYPSLIMIKMGDYNLTLRVKKLILNPTFSEGDFS